MNSLLCNRQPEKTVFHEGELARVRHIHEFVRSSFTSRHSTYDGLRLTTRVPPLPVMVQRNSLGGVWTFRSGAPLHYRSNITPVHWKDTLRRDTLTPLCNSCSRSGRSRSKTNLSCSPKVLFNRQTSEIAISREINVDMSDAAFLLDDPVFLASSVDEKTILERILNSEKGRRALNVIEQLFLPRWRLHNHLKPCKPKPTSCRNNLNSTHRCHNRVVRVAVDVILAFLRTRLEMPLTEFRFFKGEIVKLQQAFREHRKFMHACVELNYRKVRAGIEQRYWTDVVEAFEKEINETGDWDNFVSSEDVDVGDFRTVGRLPESLLRRELHSALCSRRWRIVREKEPKFESPFLPQSVYFTVLDNVCYITSILRDERILRSHLKRRPRVISVY